MLGIASRLRRDSSATAPQSSVAPADSLPRIVRMQRLTVALLGEPHIHVDDVPVHCPSKKAAGLFYFLVQTGGRRSRRELAKLFWGGDEDAARTSLRTALQRLPAPLAGWLAIERESIGLREAGDDVLEFDTHRFAELAKADDIESLTRAAELYGGDLLKNLELDAAPEYDDWLHRERAHFRQLAQSVFDRLITRHRERAQRDTAQASSGREAAMAAARRWVALEPAAETAHRWLMRLFFEAGQRDAALAQYDVCRRELAVALGRAPDAETRALGETIAAGSPAGLEGQDRRVATTNPATLLDPVLRAPEIPGTSFVGRIDELASLEQLFANPACRLLTLHAMGGVGKSRLAFALANQLAGRFALGAAWVALEAVEQANQLPQAIALALGIELSPRVEAAAGLAAALRGQERLLVLDNLEHLVAGGAAEVVLTLLRDAPSLRIIVTSREVLGVQEEWVFEVAGLGFPEPDAALSPGTSQYAAVDLFMQRARQAYLGFSPQAEWPHVVRICRLVEGLPLAIELVSAWVRTVPCADLAQALEAEMAATVSRHRNRPARHRSLDAVVRTSWQLLTREQRHALAPLSLFVGGFSQEAAAAVAGASLSVLSALVDKALVVRRADGRCGMHELVRQFLKVQLASNGGVKRDAERSFANHFAMQLMRLRGRLDSPDELAAELALSLELPNLMAAASFWLAERSDLVDTTVEAMLRILLTRGRSREAVSLAERALALPSLMPTTRALVLAYRGRAFGLLGDLAASRGDFDAAIALGRLHAMRHALAYASVYAISAAYHGDAPDAALAQLAALEPLIADLADPTITMRARYFEGLLHDSLGRTGDAERNMRRALDLARGIGAPTFLATVNSGMAAPVIKQGRLEEGESLLREALTLFEQTGSTHNVARVLNSLSLVTLWRSAGRNAADSVAMALRSFDLYGRIGHGTGQSAALDTLGQARQALGQHEQALRDFQGAVAMGPASVAAEAKFHIGWLHVELGQPERAIGPARQLVEMAQAQASEPSRRMATLLVAAVALREDRDSERAERWLRGLLAIADLDAELKRKVEALLGTSATEAGSGVASDSQQLDELREFLAGRAE